MPIEENKNQGSGAEGVAKGVTSTLGNLVGGTTRAAGGLVGAAGKGVGDTINSTTGTKAVGDALNSVTGGVKDGTDSLGKGVENAGQWKTS